MQGSRQEERLGELEGKLLKYRSSFEAHISEYNVRFANKIQTYTSELENVGATLEGSFNNFVGISCSLQGGNDELCVKSIKQQSALRDQNVSDMWGHLKSFKLGWPLNEQSAEAPLSMIEAHLYRE